VLVVCTLFEWFYDVLQLLVSVDVEPSMPLFWVLGEHLGLTGTNEGLSPDPSHLLQHAWIEIEVPQCGYCQSGQIMSAAALLKTNSDPADVEINRAISGNICRCGTYPRIRRVIRRATEMAKALT
jgi:aerobic-type carbon monoxide dehydrogenase small subunit (CoxS/CutS family)